MYKEGIISHILLCLFVPLLVCCSRKTTRTATAEHTEHHEAASLTIEQWQALSQAAWQAQLHTRSEKLTEHIVIGAKGDTVLRDITNQREVSDKTEQGSRAAKETGTTEQTEAVTTQVITQQYQQEQVSKPRGPGISSLIIGVGVAVVVIWSFLILHRVLARRSGN